MLIVQQGLRDEEWEEISCLKIYRPVSHWRGDVIQLVDIVTKKKVESRAKQRRKKKQRRIAIALSIWGMFFWGFSQNYIYCRNKT